VSACPFRHGIRPKINPNGGDNQIALVMKKTKSLQPLVVLRIEPGPHSSDTRPAVVSRAGAIDVSSRVKEPKG